MSDKNDSKSFLIMNLFYEFKAMKCIKIWKLSNMYIRIILTLWNFGVNVKLHLRWERNKWNFKIQFTGIT